jgi:flagellar basal-body rod modification protein FlgD
MATPIGTTAVGAANPSSPQTGGLMGGMDRLGKKEFLMLLIAQLRNQDPMKPMEDKEFISQLAQFSSLETMQSLDGLLKTSLNVQLLTQATSYIGKQVEAKLDDGSALLGVVTEARVVDGTPRLIVNGKEVRLEQVQKIGMGS